MTIIFKSSARSTGSVGSVHGVTGPQDFVGMLDFARGEYYTIVNGVRTNVALASAVSVARTGDPVQWLDRDGLVRIANNDQPRFRFDVAKSNYGLFVGLARTNLLKTGLHNEAVTIPAAQQGQQLVLSWEGDGELSIASASTTLVNSGSDGRRKMKRYSKSASTAIAATLTRVGNVTFPALEANALYPSERLALGQALTSDTVDLGAPFLGLLGPDMTIVLRTVFADGLQMDGDILTVAHPIAAKNGQGQGGLYTRTRTRVGSTAVESVVRYPDGGAMNSGIENVSFTSTNRREMVYGLGYKGYGTTESFISSGLFKSGDGFAAISPPNRIILGGETDAGTNASGRIGGLMTHAVIYNRHLNPAEFAVMSTMWQS